MLVVIVPPFEMTTYTKAKSKAGLGTGRCTRRGETGTEKGERRTEFPDVVEPA